MSAANLASTTAPARAPSASQAKLRGRKSHRAQVAAATSEIDRVLARMVADTSEPRVAAWAQRMLDSEASDVKPVVET